MAQRITVLQVPLRGLALLGLVLLAAVLLVLLGWADVEIHAVRVNGGLGTVALLVDPNNCVGRVSWANEQESYNKEFEKRGPCSNKNLLDQALEWATQASREWDLQPQNALALLALAAVLTTLVFWRSRPRPKT